MTWTTLLGLSVIGALVTTVGTLIGLVLKERFLVRSFEAWKAQQAYQLILRKYRDPVVLAALELCNRLEEICLEYPPSFLTTTVLESSPQPSNRTAVQDDYYWRYKLLSTVYRLCAFLGWLELFRQDVVFLDSGHHDRNAAADAAVGQIRADLADGHLNEAKDWEKWHDLLLFREEQRAIGERMIAQGSSGRVVLGYAEFSDAFDDSASERHRWLRIACKFFVDLEASRDFRETRLRRLLIHLVDLVEALDPARLRPHHLESRDRFRGVSANQRMEPTRR